MAEVAPPEATYRLDLRDLWRHAYLGFEDRRDYIVMQIRTSAWYLLAGDELRPVLYPLIDELADAACGDDFDRVWERICDLAHNDQVKLLLD